MPKAPPTALNGDHLLATALNYHDRGLSILPCNGKKPIRQGWNEGRTTREQLIADLKGTKLNIAVVLNHSDFVDVECDSADAEIKLLELFDGQIPPTPTWTSKRGKHRLFRRPPGLPEKAKVELEGIEFRLGNGKGATSILPPSKHPDGPRYAWVDGLSLDDVEPAELPPRIVARLTTRKAKADKPADTGPITEGQRNTYLFEHCCRLVAIGVSPAAVEAALLAENTARCEPPLPDEEISGIVRSALSSGSTKQKRKTADGLLLEIAGALEFWHTPNEVGYTTLEQAGHREHWPVRSRSFRQWLSKEFYQRTGCAVGSNDLKDVLTALEGKAAFDGPTYPLYLRAGNNEGRIYLDLTDEQWRAVEIDKAGWRVVDEPPIRFRRAKAMLPLAVPKSGGSVDQLRRFVNVTDADWPLLLAWLVAAFRPTGPYPILKLLAEQGSGKTTTARVLRALVDPNGAPVRSPPRDERDLMIAANNGWVVCFDNLSYVNPNLSDALCRLSTGGGFGTRTLYSDDEETIFDGQRPVILNGIEDIGTRSDLLDRALIIELPRIEPEQRLTEAVFWREFEAARLLILGALLDAVVAALKHLPRVEKSKAQWPRMADFAMWAVAAEESLGLAPGSFLTAYEANRATANQVALESSPVVIALNALLNKGRFEGTATDLHNKLSIGQDTKAKGWPKAARVLSGLLTRLAPNLRAAGIAIEKIDIGSGNNKRHGWRISGALGAKQLKTAKDLEGWRAEQAAKRDGAQGAHGSQNSGQRKLRGASAKRDAKAKYTSKSRPKRTIAEVTKPRI